MPPWSAHAVVFVFPVWRVPSWQVADVVSGVTAFLTFLAAFLVPCAVSFAASSVTCPVFFAACLVALPACFAASAASCPASLASCFAFVESSVCVCANVPVAIPNASEQAIAVLAKNVRNILPPRTHHSTFVPLSQEESAHDLCRRPVATSCETRSGLVPALRG